MGVYHITYTPELKEVCLYLDGGCSFSCHGCITDWHPEDYHIERPRQIKKRTLTVEEVLSYLNPLRFDKAIFLGKEPTEDADFLSLAKMLKESSSSYNIFLTNGWTYIEDSALNEVCVSIKAISSEIFMDFTGKDNPEQVLKNFKRYISNPDVKVMAESIFIPGYIDETEIEKIAQFIGSVNFRTPYRIDGYIPYSSTDRFRRPTKSEMERVRKLAKKYLNNVSILHSEVKVKYKVERIY